MVEFSKQTQSEGAMMSPLTPGLAGELEHVVSDADTASKWGSGLVPVFSTPALVGLMESAAVRALAGLLEAGQTTVGTRIDVRHLAATPVGMKVRARAELMAVEGRKLVFKIQAWDEVELIGEADHDRFVIDEARFVERVGKKAAG
jgi:fluoroacetyl-CoA thioesterase